MEKTLTIDGKEVKFRSSGATPIRYKAQFGRDFLTDIYKLRDLEKIKNKKELTIKEMEKIDFDLFYNLTWALAKTADKTVPEPIEWLDGFETFPVMEIFGELQDIIISTIQAKKK